MTAPDPVNARRVLVVDDDRDLARCVCELVTYLGHEATCAERGDDALEVARTFAPDVIVLDVGLPEQRHFDLARRLRAAVGTTPPMIIGMLGAADAATMARAVAIGVDQPLLKPVGLQALRRLVGDVKRALAPHEPATWAEGSDSWRFDRDGIVD